MARLSGMPVKREDVDRLPTQDDSRPVLEATSSRCMLNHCRECGQYKYVYCDVDLHDGKGLGYVCGRCRRDARTRKVTA